MANQPKNRETGARGGSVTLDIKVRAYTGGPLKDADFVPTYTIYDPNLVSVETGTSVQTGTGAYQVVHSIAADAEVSDTWKITWVVEVSGAPVSGAEEFFQVLAAGDVEFDGPIIISETFMKQVKKVMAYPTCPNIILTDDEIKDLCIRQAMQEYYVKFPIKERYSQRISEYVAIDFPDEETYGVLDARVTDKLTSEGSKSSFWDILRYKHLTGLNNRGRTGQYNTSYNFNGLSQTWYDKKQALDTVQNQMTTSYNVNYQTRQLECYSSADADITITWAKFSNDFATVRYAYQYDVITLSQGYLMEHLANTAGFVADGNLDKNVDIDAFRTQSEAKLEKIHDKWLEIPDIILVRTG